MVNKRARYNLCFAPASQEADYAAGKGTIVAYDDVPLLSAVRERLPVLLGEGTRALNAEGNLYFDTAKCGIGFHGDGERRKVVAIRLGAAIPLHYQWYRRSAPVGDRVAATLAHGDLYVMSEKAVGFDWLKRSQLTLRHAAGARKFVGK